MAPTNPNNTERFKVFYTTVGEQHTQTVRTDAMSPAAFGTLMDSLWAAGSALFNAVTIDDVQYAAAGSNIFNSVASGFEGNTYGAGAGSPGQVPEYIDFVGRSSGGKRVRLAFFGSKAIGDDYRYAAGENAVVDAMVAIIVGATNAFLSVDNVKPAWKTYVNAGFNAYWQRKTRP